MRHNLPLRGALGGGDFYQNGEIIVSAGLVDAVMYEKKQNWLGAVLTPEAIYTINATESKYKGEFDIDLSLGRFPQFVRKGQIPWKSGEYKQEYYYIKPSMTDKAWRNLLPHYFEKTDTKLDNSDSLYGE